MSRKIEPSQLLGLNREAFLAAFDDVFEHSARVAEAAWRESPFDSLEAVRAAMLRTLREGPARSPSSPSSVPTPTSPARPRSGVSSLLPRRRSRRAGLAAFTPEEFARFQELNKTYKAKFSFPFIMAVKHSDKHAILAGFKERLGNSREAELERALTEIGKIARFQLEDIIAASA